MMGEQRIDVGGFESTHSADTERETREVQTLEVQEVRTLIAAIESGILPEDLAGAATAHVVAWVEAVVE